MNLDNNIIGEAFARSFGPTVSFLDEKNILWKIINGEYIGKRSVWTFDFRACWLEETEKQNVKSWWAGGENQDYEEIFKR